MPRSVTLVLLADDGAIIGALEPFTVEPPWWSEAASVVEAARVERGADVAVLRLLEVTPPTLDPYEMGGAVAYAAELRGPVPRALVDPDPALAALALADDPLRLPWARPGGPGRELAWAESVLAKLGRAPSGPPQQMRTWNLSSIWTIPTAAGPVWLKSVPPFFAHEGATIEWIEERALPPLLGFESGRLLMSDIAGVDQYDASLPTLERAVDELVAIQHRVADHVDQLVALGLPDWRWPALRPLIDDVVARHRHELAADEQVALDRLLETYDARCAAIDGCGLPSTLVHGDFHPGNLRGDGDAVVLLDWGDCGVGHPLFDVAAMITPRIAEHREPLLEAWGQSWLRRRRDCSPLQAVALIEPIAALRQAVIYRGFLDRIEPSERCYHQSDPARWLQKAAGY